MENSVNVLKQKNMNLYKCFNQIVVTAQIFGLLPVEGIRYNKSKKINFKWYTLKAIYCHFIIITTLLVVILSVYDLLAVSTAILQKIGE